MVLDIQIVEFMNLWHSISPENPEKRLDFSYHQIFPSIVLESKTTNIFIF